MWLRGEIGDAYRKAAPTSAVRYGALSLVATMVFVLPACLAFAVAQPLEHPKVCGKGENIDAMGLYIGESKERVYLGRADENGVQVIPASGVERVIVGDGADAASCNS